MRVVHAVLLLAVSASPAFAQRVPAIVIPGRPDVPIFMNGVDISWSVVEGDFGLDRPLGVWPTVVYRPYAVVIPYYSAAAYPGGPAAYGPRYFPRDGKRPGYGRLEIEPPANRPLPPPAPSYRRSWSSQSGAGPVTEYPPFAAPPVIWNGGWSNGHAHRPRTGNGAPGLDNRGNEHSAK